MLTLIVFLVILTILVLIHELGHFIMARKFRIKVEEFGFGFPPRAFGIKKGETLYSINWLPIGGFVKLYGEDEAGGGRISTKNPELITQNLQRAFFAKPVWQRAIVVVAGVVMNILLAIVIYYAFLSIGNFKTEVALLSDYRFFGVNQTNVTDVIIGKVAPNSPAQQAGIKDISKVVSINGEEVKDIDMFVKTVNEQKGKEITLDLQQLETNETYTVNVIPRISPPPNEGALGVALSTFDKAVLSYDTPAQRVFSGVIHPINLTIYEIDILGRLIATSFRERTVEPVGEAVSGPVGIFSIFGSILKIPDLKEKILQGLNLAGLISISLAIFNILPIPAVDGGRLFFILGEGLTGRKVNPRVEALIHNVGFALLLGLLALVTFRDISRLFSG